MTQGKDDSLQQSGGGGSHEKCSGPQMYFKEILLIGKTRGERERKDEGKVWGLSNWVNRAAITELGKQGWRWQRTWESSALLG